MRGSEFKYQTCLQGSETHGRQRKSYIAKHRAATQIVIHPTAGKYHDAILFPSTKDQRI